jgi:hypothetical protein
VVDTNPPLVIWLCGLEVGLARLLGASPFVVHALTSCAVGVIGVALAGRALVRAGVASEVIALWAPPRSPPRLRSRATSSGQREHWIAFPLLPYAGLGAGAALALARARSRGCSRRWRSPSSRTSCSPCS